MPARVKANKVSKPHRQDKGHPREDAVALKLQEHLEQSNNIFDDAGTGFGYGSASGHPSVQHAAPFELHPPSSRESSLSPGVFLDSDLLQRADSSVLLLQQHPSPPLSNEEAAAHYYASQPQPTTEPRLTAVEVAFGRLGTSINTDSALSKRLAGETAVREATQRRHEQKLNMDRRSNVEALFAHMTGIPAAQPCKNCYKGHGPWTECIVYENQLCGSCSNCWYNASGSRCTFHETNVHPVKLPAASRTPAVPDTTAPLRSSTDSPSPENTAGSILSMPSLGGVDIQVLASVHNSVETMNTRHPSRNLVRRSMGDGIHFSKQSRYVARIEAAAEELGMRIAEYDEYLCTPEGVAKNQRLLTEQGHDAQRAPTATMDTSCHGDTGKMNGILA
ncbi:hypothetical protein S40285_00158 [Stachybotrys chlorohalonatus IBT 40285]|uniref:Uncharacterized protein n=1 Tax=Stachybotrys chlorohalonatus (strain IBT 40285) TaxID=1283841 RepID=A0A084QTW3_STAC4|nr:hypothetical protein S40285_00158 [Stachybotrys chlorohalonata IBT 40285]